jgi:hypothetical protein
LKLTLSDLLSSTYHVSINFLRSFYEIEIGTVKLCPVRPLAEWVVGGAQLANSRTILYLLSCSYAEELEQSTQRAGEKGREKSAHQRVCERERERETAGKKS